MDSHRHFFNICLNRSKKIENLNDYFLTEYLLSQNCYSCRDLTGAGRALGKLFLLQIIVIFHFRELNYLSSFICCVIYKMYKNQDLNIKNVVSEKIFKIHYL